MTFGKLIFKSAFRNKRRSFLTIGSIAFSLFLLTTLQTVLTEFNRITEGNDQSQFRLIIRRSTSIADPIPQSYRAKIIRVPHVKAITAMTWFGGIYKEEKNFFANFACDQDTFFDVYSEFTVSPEHLLKFKREKTAAIAGQKLFDQFGWKLGDRITLQSTIFPLDLEVTLGGIYHGADEAALFFRRDYFEEASGWNWIGTYALLADSPDAIPQIIQTIDSMFRNSAAETKTETEKQFNLDFMAMLGNVKNLILSISTVVIFTILLVCTTTMSMSIREQIKEIAVLKTMGFPKQTIYFLVISEAIAITLLGGLFGCLGAWLFYSNFDMASLTRNFFSRFDVTTGTIIQGILVSLLVGLISSIIPAYNAIKMTVTEGLKHIG